MWHIFHVTCELFGCHLVVAQSNYSLLLANKGRKVQNVCYVCGTNIFQPNI